MEVNMTGEGHVTVYKDTTTYPCKIKMRDTILSKAAVSDKERKHLTEEEKDEILSICDEKLKSYFDKLK